jgi:eukaryotic-like serine/threonine-protein kinase
MENLDGATFGQIASRLGLLNEAQLLEALEELGVRNPPFDALVNLLERRGFITPWQTGKIKRGDADGFFLGGYRILYRVAAGSFGRVYRADDPRTGRMIALKVLRGKWSRSDNPENQQIIDMFIREGKLGLALRHPNIVEVLAVAKDPSSGQYYIAMDFVEGGNLREILQIRKRLKLPEAMQILEEAASGLAYAFSKGVTHRDVKLTNLLISSQGLHCKLVDFGLAQMFETVENTRKEKDRINRTVDYAGLERATAVKEGDVRSDIYFLGCVFYEMLTGRSPLVMTRARQLRMQRTRFEEVRPISRDELSAPASVFLLAETMMALNPSSRYQTLTQLLDAVRAARRDVDGVQAPVGATAAPEAPTKVRTVFVVEKDDRLMNTMRDRFKEFGYRVLITMDPARAIERFRQQPYDALVVDAGTTDVEGRTAFERVLAEADRREVPFAGVLLLSEEQAGWKEDIPNHRRAAILMMPANVKQIHQKLDAILRA